MKQVLHSLATGRAEVAEIPAPRPPPGHLLIRSGATLVSAGTERMLVEFGRAGLLAKVRQQPDKVRQVLEKIRTDGLAATLEAVRSKLDQPVALGYCNVGRVIEIGAGVRGFAVGDRVVSNGKHAELVVAPQNLCAKVPERDPPIPDEAAVFTVLAAIGLQGIRLAQPTLGESVVVTGLGVIGLLTVQLLRASGCRVLGLDLDPQRLALARRFGAEVVDLAAGQDPIAAAHAFTAGRGVDAVLLTAATTSSEPVAQAAQICRKRGRIVLVGVTGLQLSRADFYAKELSFQVSCSYGPGRYDPDYEDRGHDYPFGLVRWTEQRNFEAVLELIAAGALDLAPLLSHRFELDDAAAAYDLLASERPSLGIVLGYPEPQHDPEDSPLSSPPRPRRTIELPEPRAAPAPGAPVVAVIGAGNYGGRVLIDALGRAGADLRAIASASGVSAVYHGRRARARQASSDPDALLADPQIQAVVISTRHDSHARLVIAAIDAGKHVFCEKPLALTLDQLAAIEAALAARAPDPPILMVGFNRRFAPHIIKLRALLAGISAPKHLTLTVNAGAIPSDHWTQDPQLGGGRLLGEACHFIDLIRHLVGAPIAAYDVQPLTAPGGPPTPDSATITLRLADGSLGVIHYLAGGHKAVPKERLEVFVAGRVLHLDNFRVLRGHGVPGFRAMRLWRQDKGADACVAAFVDALRRGGPAPIPLAELLEVSRLAVEIAEAAR
jgi:predicted dehydrogenase/threonine dehydrogenase-like Zn-dependent dehydrogenase